jgi:hypothetical protein
VGLLDDADGIEIMVESPGTPHSFHGRGRVDEDSVHVKKDGFG